MLYRFYEPDQGRVLINGKDINQVKLESLRECVAVVPQDCVLFHDTIEYNINYGDLNASKEDVIRVAKMAELHDSIMSWPQGYQTQVTMKHCFLLRNV